MVYDVLWGIILRIHHSWIYQYTLWKSNMFPARNLWFGGFSSQAWEHLMKSHCIRLMFPLKHQCRWSNLQQDYLRNIWLVVWIYFSIYNQIYSTKWWGQFPCSGAFWTSPKSQVRWDALKEFLAVLKIRGDFCPPGKMMTFVFFLDMNLKIRVYPRHDMCNTPESCKKLISKACFEKTVLKVSRFWGYYPLVN